uniref:Putative arabinosyltransferase ARAD1 n=1 Tax=Rhizophora mucronata TaxID=61149 RepID=A0A2P2JDY3_RHIMU
MAGQGISSSKFYINIAGDTPSSNRLFDAIVSHCFFVLISDDTELPFEDTLDYSEFCVFVHASDVEYLLNLLCRIRQKKRTKVWERLKEIVLHVEYHHPSQAGMLWI